MERTGQTLGDTMSYVVKVSSRKLGVSANIYKKNWSEDLFSNQLNLISHKDFIFKFRAKRWAEKEMIKILINNKEMEIINGRS